MVQVGEGDGQYGVQTMPGLVRVVYFLLRSAWALRYLAMSSFL